MRAINRWSPGRRRQRRVAAWLAVLAILWHALQPFASLAAASGSGHLCPTTGLHSLALAGGIDETPALPDAARRLHCGFCVGLLAPTAAISLLPTEWRAPIADEPAGVDTSSHELKLLTAAPPPSRGPPRPT